MISPRTKSKWKVFWVLRIFSIHTSRTMLLGLRTYMSAQKQLLLGTIQRGPRITKPYLTSSKQPSIMLLLCIFRITPYLGLSALTPLTMRSVLSCSKSSPRLLVQSCINQLRSPPTNTRGLPLSGTRLNKRHMPYTSLSPNLVTTSAAKTFYLRRIIVTSFGSKLARFLLLFHGVFSCEVPLHCQTHPWC